MRPVGHPSSAADRANLTVRTRDGSELAVQRRGTGPALLLLPGQANSHQWWTGIREVFESSFTTITFDYRGTGETRAAEDDTWSTGSFAQDAAHVLDACGVSAAHVYATSMGGRVAQMLAAAAPDRVDRLVLACTSPGGSAASERSQDVRRTLSQADPSARRRALLDLMYTPAWFARGLTSHLTGDPTMTPRARFLHLRLSNSHDATEALTAITAPTLILHGDADQMAPVENAHTLQRGISGSDLHVTTGGRHGFFDEFADDITPQVICFLQSSP